MEVEKEVNVLRVRHPGIVPVYGIVRFESGPDGIILHDLGPDTTTAREKYVDSWRTAGEHEWLSVAKDVFGALAAIHKAGLCHGDVHLGNILISGGRGYLCSCCAKSSECVKDEKERDVLALAQSLVEMRNGAPAQLKMQIASYPEGVGFILHTCLKTDWTSSGLTPPIAEDILKALNNPTVEKEKV